MSDAINLSHQQRQLSESLARTMEYIVIADSKLHDAKAMHADAKQGGDTKVIDACESKVFDAQQQVDRLNAKALRIRDELDAVKAVIAKKSLGSS